MSLAGRPKSLIQPVHSSLHAPTRATRFFFYHCRLRHIFGHKAATSTMHGSEHGAVRNMMTPLSSVLVPLCMLDIFLQCTWPETPPVKPLWGVLYHPKFDLQKKRPRPPQPTHFSNGTFSQISKRIHIPPPLPQNEGLAQRTKSSETPRKVPKPTALAHSECPRETCHLGPRDGCSEPPPPPDRTMMKFGRPILADIHHFRPLEKNVIFGPHRIHLRVQHVPLKNWMGLMTCFERNCCFNILDHFWRLRKKIRRLRWQHVPFTIRGTEEFRKRHFVILGPSESPHPHQNNVVTTISIPGPTNRIAQGVVEATGGTRRSPIKTWQGCWTTCSARLPDGPWLVRAGPDRIGRDHCGAVPRLRCTRIRNP